MQFYSNLLLTRYSISATPATTDLVYQLQLKYRYQASFEFGIQGFGTLGPWYHWSALDAQSHRLGPAIFGRWALGGRQALYYNAAWLFGLTSGAASNTLRAQIEFEF